MPEVPVPDAGDGVIAAFPPLFLVSTNGQVDPYFFPLARGSFSLHIIVRCRQGLARRPLGLDRTHFLTAIRATCKLRPFGSRSPSFFPKHRYTFSPLRRYWR